MHFKQDHFLRKKVSALPFYVCPALLRGVLFWKRPSRQKSIIVQLHADFVMFHWWSWISCCWLVIHLSCHYQTLHWCTMWFFEHHIPLSSMSTLHICFILSGFLFLLPFSRCFLQHIFSHPSLALDSRAITYTVSMSFHYSFIEYSVQFSKMAQTD